MKTRFLLLLFLSSYLSISQQVVVPDYVYNIRDVDHIRNGAFVETNAIMTQGYYNPDDGGGAYYIVEDNPTAVDNGGSIIKINGTDLIAKLVPRGHINVKQFGAYGNDNSSQDDSGPINDAILYCLKNNLHELIIPEGSYYIKNSIEIINQFNHEESRPKGLSLTGVGPGNVIDSLSVEYIGGTKFKSHDSLVGPMLRIDGQPTGATVEQGSGQYLNGGTIKGIFFDGLFNGNENNHGLLMGAWWNGSIEDCVFQQFKGDAIRQDSATTTENPDWYASISINFSHVLALRCEGYGFNNIVQQGAPGFTFENCIFNMCQKGGAYIRSSSTRFITSSFAAAGWKGEKEDPITDYAYGIHFDSGSLTANSRMIVEGCEFDNNKDAHIAASYLANSRIKNNRFIHEDRPEDSIKAPRISVYLAAPDDNPSTPNGNEAMRNVDFSNNFVRINSTTDVDVFKWRYTGNVVNIFINNTTLTNEKNSIVTVFKGYDVNDAHIKNNYVLDNSNGFLSSLGTTNNDFVSHGKPTPFYLGSFDANSPQPNAVAPAFDVVKFTNPDDIFNTSSLLNNYYDTSTGIFTCPETGFYNIDVFLSLKNLLTSQRARLHVTNVTQSKDIFYDYIWGEGLNTRVSMDISNKFYANKGDQITINISGDGGVQVDAASPFNSLLIQLDK